MKPKPREAREHLLKALAALEDPQAYCRQQEGGRLEDDAKDPSRALPCAVGAAKFRIEYALQLLGEPIDPYRPLEAGPYVRPTERERIEMDVQTSPDQPS